MATQSKTWIDYVLWVLLAIGLFGVARVSLENFNGNPCPHILLVPVCYVVLVGYAMMAVSVIVWHSGCRHYFFAIGWSIASAIALVGSIAEFASGGGVCPSSGGGSIRGASESGAIPLCYVSLALLLIILVFFLLGPYRRTCEISNARP